MGDAAGLSRLNRVSVATRGGPKAISLQARAMLLERLRRVDGAIRIRAAFLAVGATRPVELGTDDRELLVDVIDDWATRVGGLEKLPAGISDLRDALVAEIDGTSPSP